MRSRSVPIAIAVAVLSAGGAVACYTQGTQLRNQASWLLERGSAEGDEYANTFDDSAADKQQELLEQRRAVLDQVALWQRGQLLLILLSVVSAFSSYVLFLFARLRASART